MTAIIGIAGSLRRGSYNARLLRACAALAPRELEIGIASIAEVPLYDGDVEREQGVPGPVAQLKDEIARAQGLLLVSPEYNNSMPPLLKNTIDWISRIKGGEIPYRHRVFGIGSTSDGYVGGARALIDVRKSVLSGLGGIIIPEKVEVGRAQDAFDESGNLIAEAPAKLLKSLCRHLVELAARLVDEPRT